MSNPKHQHFIPKSYLKNFSIKKDDKYFVEVKHKQEKKAKDQLLSIRDICVDKNLYTIPQLEGDDKYSIEKYYAKEIDSLYPEIYELLVNEKVNFINNEQRIQIILTTMSLFFRTPKFLNYKERRINKVLEYGVRNHIDNDGNVKFKIFNYDFDFHIDNIEQIKTNIKIENKLIFLQDHLESLHKFTQFKANAGLSVFHMNEDIDLITSDNPVIMHSVVGNSFNVFDPTNIISLPLDTKHFLTIFPNTSSSLTDRVFRGDQGKWFALATNFQVDNNSEDWIIGRPHSICAHISDQKQYGEQTTGNLQALEDLKEKSKDSQELLKIIEKVGTIAHQNVANKVRELRRKRIHLNDPEMSKMVLELARHGFLTV